MAETTSDNYVELTPEIKALLAGIAEATNTIRAREQALLEGFLAANGKNGGKWTMLPDGSGLLREEPE